jgi:ABC-2 type transport system permease protein
MAQTRMKFAEILSYRELLKNLLKKDLKLKYRGSIFGFLWSFLNPLLMITIYTVVFGTIMRIRMQHYSLFLITGLLPWIFFCNSCIMATTAIIDNASLIKKVYFPRFVLPLSTILFNLVQMLLAFCVFLPFLIVQKGGSLHMLAFPLVLSLHLIFTFGISLFLSSSTVFFRDIKHLMEVSLLALFWITPVIYPVFMIPDKLRIFVKINPLAIFVVLYRECLFYHKRLDPLLFTLALSWSIFMLWVGYRIFIKQSPRFAEEI